MTTAPLPLGDAALERVVADGLVEVERRLAAAVSSTEILADAPSRHLVNAGGKRMRPALALLTAQLGSGTSDAVLEAAVAVELTHLATLYHDDVMDSAPTRRGAPSAHEVWGNSVAILTGDLLFARASRLVSELGPDAVRVQAETFERLCLGQLHETIGPQDGEDAVEHYLDVLAGKTGSLIAASAQYGAMFSGVGADALGTVVRYGEKVGVAFQLADDVIDLLSDADVTGKTPGTDLREGVATMPVLLLRARADRGAVDDAGRAVLERLDGDLSDDAALDAVLAELRAHDVLDEARDLARAWAADAVAELDGLPDSPVKRALAVFASLVVDRLA
ncbi:Polyprenyl synthetase [Beutenbergia cavernae DSM 12333]|uniref:Polyprenyl synthetase n=1 Tax=Beutenbergia cavernae (strain ATCC BAA-8 / DSM 12333 / CCUG 43141 / JCM 11478 / NBRC 16432 / NCIMB 13614 / HKI 0122) TaxID=471853 RepID=C5C0R3_BEUC1|nr:polyprenyl synthetase family protein [Beutenbergia cavernae]ACQ81459.1 Polyprenyl synthetase [Beutenbergia cavernae DSM 12333]